MKRRLAGALVGALMMLVAAPMAMAAVQSGEGINGGGQPVDPMPITPNCRFSACVGYGASRGGGTGAFVQVGNEDAAGSVGRVSVAVGDSGNLVSIYEEQYLPGDPVHGVLETVNRLSGCRLKANKKCTPNHDDAGLITIP
jgi:hypothetical protein